MRPSLLSLHNKKSLSSPKHCPIQSRNFMPYVGPTSFWLWEDIWNLCRTTSWSRGSSLSGWTSSKIQDLECSSRTNSAGNVTIGYWATNCARDSDPITVPCLLIQSKQPILQDLQLFPRMWVKPSSNMCTFKQMTWWAMQRRHQSRIKGKWWPDLCHRTNQWMWSTIEN